MAVGLLGVARAQAATLTVVNTNDSGPGSLRAAFAAAASGDTIAFAASLTGATIVLTMIDPSTVDTVPTTPPGPTAPFGPTGLVVDGKDVTIDGSGAPGLTISGGDALRMFAVTGAGGSGANRPATQGVLRLANLTLAHGLAQGGDGGSAISGGGGAAGLGGAIFVDAGSKAVLVGCLVTACTAKGGAGGAPGFGAGGGSGGGLSGNGGSSSGGPPNGSFGGDGGFGGGGGTGGGAAGGGGGFGGGGGGAGTTFAGVGGFGGGGGGGGAGLGGGVFVNGGTFEATNSTFTGCTGGGGSGGTGGLAFGGAIFQRNGTVTLTFCTVADNTAATSGAGLFVLADGGATATLVLNSTIVNQDAWGFELGGGTLAAPGGDGKNVVVFQNAFVPPIGTVSTADPKLQPLASNGGPTQTMALGAGSPAHDAGNAAITTLTAPSGAGGVDQRGLPRRIGVSDVGAYETQPVAVSVLSGGGQSTTVGTAFGVALVISATDPFGAGLNGYAVSLTPPASGASASFLPAPLVTNASGLATATATANTKPGSYSVALVGSSTPFTLTNVAGAPASLSVVSGGGQKTLVSTAFAQPIVLQVSDSFGNPVAGVALSLSPPSSGASANLSTTSPTTGSNGQASVTATANATGGTYTVNVSGAGLNTSFQLTNQTPASTPVLSGGGQSVAVGSAFGTPIVIQVTDASGNPIAGVTVTLAAPGSGASATFSPASLVTDAAGKISATATANGTAGGPYTVTITAGSVTSTFQLTNLPSTSGGGGGSGGFTGSGHHGGSGCALGGRDGSPASLAPLLLALVGLVWRKRRGSSSC